jgi:hypothetical protein
MPRNDIAAIIGLIVALVWLFAWPRPERGLPRTLRGYLPALIVFCIAFLVTWIVLRLLGI